MSKSTISTVIQRQLTQLREHTLGQRIVSVGLMPMEEARGLMGWDRRPVMIVLGNGVTLTCSSDEEGNEPGTLMTNLNDVPIVGAS